MDCFCDKVYALVSELHAMKMPTEVQRRTCAAENTFFSKANFLRHRYDQSIVKLYVLHYVV